MLEDLAILVTAALLVIGSLFALVASIGLLRFPDVYTRMHSASKAGTLGSGLLLVAIAIYTDDIATATRSLAGVVFFMLTTPISTHLLAKASYAVGYRLAAISVHDDMPRDRDPADAGESA